MSWKRRKEEVTFFEKKVTKKTFTNRGVGGAKLWPLKGRGSESFLRSFFSKKRPLTFFL
jgi:hypothetical protein